MYGTYHNLIGLRDLSDLSGAKLAVLDVGSTAGTNARDLSGGVNTNEDDVGLSNGAVDVGGEEKIPAE
jgi:TRAP-type uncharacterized transport system substrate-binding protein